MGFLSTDTASVIALTGVFIAVLVLFIVELIKWLETVPGIPLLGLVNCIVVFVVAPIIAGFLGMLAQVMIYDGLWDGFWFFLRGALKAFGLVFIVVSAFRLYRGQPSPLAGLVRFLQGLRHQPRHVTWTNYSAPQPPPPRPAPQPMQFQQYVQSQPNQFQQQKIDPHNPPSGVPYGWLLRYHGTPKLKNALDMLRNQRFKINLSTRPNGIYLSPDFDYAKSYAGSQGGVVVIWADPTIDFDAHDWQRQYVPINGAQDGKFYQVNGLIVTNILDDEGNILY